LFIAVTKNGERYCAFEEQEAKLRDLSFNTQLHCPDCFTAVVFRKGSKAAHFAHKVQCVSPNPYSEPESPTHRKGKMHLYLWLKKSFPNAEVQLEYFIKETQQRADIIVIHPNNERWAIEFQCSKIPGYRWKERHHLYVNAQIKDYWILDANMLNEQHKRNGLEETIYTTTASLAHYDPEMEEISLLVTPSTHRRQMRFKEPLSNYTIRSTEYRHPVTHNIIDQIRIANIEYQQYLKEKEDKRLMEEERRKRIEYESSRVTQDMKSRYREIYKNRGSITKGMTDSELESFLKLTTKYKLNASNFPSYCLACVPFNDLIITPNAFWQLWVYDYIVTYFKKRIMQDKDTTIWTDYLKQKFVDLRKQQLLRIQSNSHSYENYTFTLYSYIDLLCNAQLLTKLGSSSAKYYRIEYESLPLTSSEEENIFLQMYFEGYQHTKLTEAFIEYRERTHTSE